MEGTIVNTHQSCIIWSIRCEVPQSALGLRVWEPWNARSSGAWRTQTWWGNICLGCFSVQIPPAQRCQEVPPMQFQIPSSKHNSTGVLGLDLEAAELRSPEKIIMDDYLWFCFALVYFVKYHVKLYLIMAGEWPIYLQSSRYFGHVKSVLNLKTYSAPGVIWKKVINLPRTIYFAVHTAKSGALAVGYACTKIFNTVLSKFEKGKFIQNRSVAAWTANWVFKEFRWLHHANELHGLSYVQC